MPSILLTWNPSRPHAWKKWEERYPYSDGYYRGQWACVTKSVEPGDRVFVMRLGGEPRGIVASGYADSTSFNALHWDPALAAQGKYIPCVKVKLDTVLDQEAPLPWSLLRRDERFTNHNWTPQASGIRISEPAASHLESVWAEFLASRQTRAARV